MKITINTKEDSREEIKRIIQFLTAYLGESATTNSRGIFNDELTASSGGTLTSLFGDDSSSSTPVLKKDDDNEPEPQVQFIY